MQQAQRNSTVVSISLQPEEIKILREIVKTTGRTKSGVMADLLREKKRTDAWEQILRWGRETREKFNIKSEEDVLRIIND